MAGGGAKHDGAVRSRGGRRKGTGPVVTVVSRKIINTASESEIPMHKKK